MPLPKDEKALQLSKDLIESLDALAGGEHAGYRPVHAKGVMFAGVFKPAKEAAEISAAPHAQSETPVTVRVSDFAGVPTIADNDPEGAGPRGFAVRFHLGEHLHTDIVAHSVDAFPTRTAEEFLEFARAVAASAKQTEHPNAIEQFLTAHPKAMEFVQIPKPIPVSFAHEAFYAVSAFRMTGVTGASRYVRYRMLPVAGKKHLTAEEAVAKGSDFLFEEIRERVAKGPVSWEVWLQVGNEGDMTDDATMRWPEDRKLVKFGEIVVDRVVDTEETRRIIFDPIPRGEGIEVSDDPLLVPRADVYLMSGRRRRAASA